MGRTNKYSNKFKVEIVEHYRSDRKMMVQLEHEYVIGPIRWGKINPFLLKSIINNPLEINMTKPMLSRFQMNL